MSPSTEMPWWVLPGLAALVILSFDAALCASLFVSGNETLRVQMFTAATTFTGAVVGFYWGSSAGSAKKDQTIAESQTALANSTPGAAVTTTTHVDARGATTTTEPAAAVPTADKPPPATIIIPPGASP